MNQYYNELVYSSETNLCGVKLDVLSNMEKGDTYGLYLISLEKCSLYFSCLG